MVEERNERREGIRVPKLVAHPRGQRAARIRRILELVDWNRRADIEANRRLTRSCRWRCNAPHDDRHAYAPQPHLSHVTLPAVFTLSSLSAVSL